MPPFAFDGCCTKARCVAAPGVIVIAELVAVVSGVTAPLVSVAESVIDSTRWSDRPENVTLLWPAGMLPVQRAVERTRCPRRARG